jgi:hypothetical protein
MTSSPSVEAAQRRAKTLESHPLPDNNGSDPMETRGHGLSEVKINKMDRSSRRGSARTDEEYFRSRFDNISRTNNHTLEVLEDM